MRRTATSPGSRTVLVNWHATSRACAHERVSMDRRDALIAPSLASAALAARAQRAETVRRIAVLMSAGEASSQPLVDGLLEGLRDKG